MNKNSGLRCYFHFSGALLKLKDLGEFKLIDQIRRQAKAGAGVLRGIGDDAAVLQIPERHTLLTSTDLLIEGIHFRREWTSCSDLGHKAVAVNVSDIAAMGASPRYLYLALACPEETSQEEIQEFLSGALDEAKQHGASLVGGDTCRSPGPWFISVTIEGTAPPQEVVYRNGARPGDLVMVSGTLGDSALAIRLLQQGLADTPWLLQRHHRPTPRVAFGRQLGEQRLASAMIDISDGLAGDLEHILQESQVNGLIEANQLPLSTDLRTCIGEPSEALDLALFGGEDYELLFTVPPKNAGKAASLAESLGLTATVIGEILEGSGQLMLRDAGGDIRPILVRGYDHFCRS